MVSRDDNRLNVVVVGGGKMGLPLACQIADRGAHVTVCDLNSRLVHTVNDGRAPFVEPGLEESLRRNVLAGRLNATVDTAEAARQAQVIIVIVPALLTSDKQIDYAHLKAASRDVARGLQSGTLVCYETTVPVGGCRSELVPCLEESGLRAGQDFLVAFSPERVKSQLVFQRLQCTPKVVGGFDQESSTRAVDFYERYLGVETINVGTLEAAEFVKLAGMLYRDVNIALANELAALCEKSGLEFGPLANAANTDGEANLLQPGIGVGGHCTPVYPYFMISSGERRGAGQRLSQLARQVNEDQPRRHVDRLLQALGSLEGKRIHILGLGFRPGVKEHAYSPAFPLRDLLCDANAQVTLEDALYADEELRSFGFQPSTHHGAKAVVLNTAHENFASPDFAGWHKEGVRVVLDGRNIWSQQAAEAAGLIYLGVGVAEKNGHSTDKRGLPVPADPVRRGAPDPAADTPALRAPLSALDRPVRRGSPDPAEPPDRRSPTPSSPPPLIPITKPFLDDSESLAAAEVIRSGWVAQGPKVAEFERMVADYCGTKHAVAVSSGTAALHLSLLALGIGPGDEVICPSLSFIATANSIRLAGATPVFADIDPRTYNLDPAAVEAAITERTKAIMVVHQIGLPADIDRFNELGRKYGVKVLEDAACALGSRYKGVPIGGHTEVACFSFHPRKVITTGEGGMVTTNNADYAEQIRLLRQHGMRVVPSLEANAAASASKEEYLCVAYNYRMTDIQAAIGIEQMKKLDRILKQRRELAAKYDDALHVSDHLESPFVPSYAEPNYQSYAVQLIADLADSRDRLIQQLHRSGISVRTGITLAHLACPYRDSATTDLPNSCDASRRSILLPLYPSMTANEQDGVVAAVRALIPSIVYAVG